MGALATPLQQWVISDAVAGWSQNVTFAQFDPTLGTLLDVRVGLTGDVSGSIAIESLEDAASVLAASLPGRLTVFGPGGGVITSVAPSIFVSGNLGAFDGGWDYAGTSGETFAGLSDQQSAVAAYRPDANDLPQFIGTGSVTLSVGSWAGLNATGPANLQMLATADAGATITLQYDYLAPGDSVPGSGGGSFGGVVDAATNIPIPIYFNGAVTTAPQVFTVADSTTGWSNGLTVNRFDPSLGTIEAVNVTLAGDIVGNIAVENGAACRRRFRSGRPRRSACRFPAVPIRSHCRSLSPLRARSARLTAAGISPEARDRKIRF